MLLGAVFAGIVAVTGYALLTRLFPDRIGTYDRLAVYRLADPVGYWNGLGVLAAMGSLLALGIAARAERTWARALARGEPGRAGAHALLHVQPRIVDRARGGDRRTRRPRPERLRTITAALVCAPAPAAAVAIASRSHALTHPHSAMARAAHDGHRLALVMVGLVAVQCLVVWPSRRVQARWDHFSGGPARDTRRRS